MSKDKLPIIESISEYSSGRLELSLNLRQDGKPLRVLLRLSRREFEELAVGLGNFMELMIHEDLIE